MGAAVMRRDDLQVVDLATAVPVLILDADIWELDVLIFVRQPVRQRPLPHLVGRAIGPAVAITFLAIPLLKEALILALQLVVEDHATDLAAAFSYPFRGALVCAVEVHVMGDLGPPLDGVASRYSAGQLRLRIVDMSRVNPETIMPSYHRAEGLNRVAAPYRGRPVLTAQQVEDTVAFLLTLR